MIKKNRNTSKDAVQQSKPRTLPKAELSEDQLDAIAGGFGIGTSPRGIGTSP